MTAAPPRRFWQIHLSTAVVLMFVAGRMMWVNMRPDEEVGSETPYRSLTITHQEALESDRGIGTWYFTDYQRLRRYGWPLRFMVYDYGSVHATSVAWAQFPGSPTPGEPTLVKWSVQALLCNIATGLLLLLIISQTMEFILRPRESRR